MNLLTAMRGYSHQALQQATGLSDFCLLWTGWSDRRTRGFPVLY